MLRDIKPLTAIRGVAAIWVVAHHIQPLWLPDAPTPIRSVLDTGWCAVDVFFVLSGFILAKVHGDLRPRSAGRFWLRRLLRVYPLPLCLIAVLATHHLLQHGALHWADFPASALMLQALFLDHLGWNAPTWSVGIELICYALFPLLAPATRRLRTPEALALLACLLIGEHWTLTHCAGAVVGTGAVLRGLVGFSIGTTLARLPLPWGRRSTTLIEAAGALTMLAGLYATAASLVVTGAIVLIAALARETGPLAALLSRRAPVWLGTVSYSVYVLHASLIGLVNKAPMLQSPIARLAVALVVLLPLSHLTHRWIEEPGRRLARRLDRRPPPHRATTSGLEQRQPDRNRSDWQDCARQQSRGNGARWLGAGPSV